jgi:hypothetical protein
MARHREIQETVFAAFDFFAPHLGFEVPLREQEQIFIRIIAP